MQLLSSTIELTFYQYLKFNAYIHQLNIRLMIFSIKQVVLLLILSIDLP